MTRFKTFPCRAYVLEMLEANCLKLETQAKEFKGASPQTIAKVLQHGFNDATRQELIFVGFLTAKFHELLNK